MGGPNENNFLGTRPGSSTDLSQDEPQIHVSGIFIVLLEVALIIENSLPILVVLTWLPACARGVGDRLIAAFSVTCILSALIPTPLGLASYFTGSWYGGSPTCSTYQVTSTWCNLSALALLSYMCVNCHCAVSRLLNFRIEAHVINHACSQNKSTLPESPLDLQQGSSSPNHCGDQQGKPSTNHPVSIDGDHPNSSSQNQSIANAEQTNHKSNGILPGTSVSSFESSKLEFLSENAHHTNAVLNEESSSYAQIKEVPEIEGTESSCQNDMTEVYLSSSRTNSTVPQRSDIDGETQPESTTPKYDAVLPPNSHENGILSGGHNHCDMSLTDKSLIYENSTFLYSDRPSQTDHRNKTSGSDDWNHQRVIQNADLPPEPRLFRAKDYISIALFFLYSITLTISSLPVVGFGPQHDPTSKLCRSWLVPSPQPQRERVFFIAFLTCVYVCMLIGCLTAARVGYLVSKRVKQEMRRTTRLYHEEENVPDIRELSVLDDLKRHHSLSCLAVCGILTWLPIAIMLTLQKSGVHISEATLVYSNIATSLPCLLNPLLYSLILARYREGYKAILERCRRKKGPQKPHRLRNVQHCCDLDPTTDTDVISTSNGHRCVHGRPNPTFDSSSFDEDVLEDEDDEEKSDFVEDFDQYFNNKVTKYTFLDSKMSEKTPLHATTATSKHTTSMDARSSGIYHNKRQWSLPTSQSHEDEKCLLANEVIVKEESETRL